MSTALHTDLPPGLTMMVTMLFGTICVALLVYLAASRWEQREQRRERATRFARPEPRGTRSVFSFSFSFHTHSRPPPPPPPPPPQREHARRVREVLRGRHVGLAQLLDFQAVGGGGEEVDPAEAEAVQAVIRAEAAAWDAIAAVEALGPDIARPELQALIPEFIVAARELADEAARLRPRPRRNGGEEVGAPPAPPRRLAFGPVPEQIGPFVAVAVFFAVVRGLYIAFFQTGPAPPGGQGAGGGEGADHQPGLRLRRAVRRPANGEAAGGEEEDAPAAAE